jgi:hypothetical protein
MVFPVAARYDVCYCDRLIAGSNPAVGMDVRLVCLLCRLQPHRPTDHSLGALLPDRLDLGCGATREKSYTTGHYNLHSLKSGGF